MKRSLKSNIQKLLWPWILFNFFDLIASIHKHDSKPNPRRLEAAQKTIGKTWNFHQKAQN